MKSKPFILGENAVFLKEIAIFLQCNQEYKVLYVKIIQTLLGITKLYT